MLGDFIGLYQRNFAGVDRSGLAFHEACKTGESELYVLQLQYPNMTDYTRPGLFPFDNLVTSD